jgi:hypothetical protein
MNIAILFAAALTAAPAADPERGVVGLPNIDQAAYDVVNGMVESASADGQPSTRFFAEPLASALADGQRPAGEGEAPRLAPDWLSGGGPIGAVTDTSLYSLNRSGVDDIVMGLGFTNAEGERVYRRLHLGCHEGLWRIDSLFLHPEGVFLNELLAREP